MEENFYIDHFGHPYDHESGDSWPAGGGLDKRCDYNAEALFCYYALKNRDAIAEYLDKRGFDLMAFGFDSEWYRKGNTDIYFEGYDPNNDGGLYGYLHTEIVDTYVPEQ